MIKQVDFINLILALSSVWIIKKYLNIMFIKKKQFVKMVLWILFFMLQFLLEKGKGEASIPVIFINIFLVTLISIFLYEVSLRKSLLYITLLYAMWVLTEFSVFFIVKFMSLEMGNTLILGSILSKMVMFK